MVKKTKTHDMAQLKKVLLIQTPVGVNKFIPLEDIAKISGVIDYDIIVPDEKTTIMVHEKTTSGRSIYDPGLADSVIVRKITEEDITFITANNRECFIEVDYKNEPLMPSNGLGRKMLVIHLTREEAPA
jgi:hypothetical protein